MTPGTERGFTLLELIVATAIFAVLAALSWRGLQTVLENRQRIELQAERLGQLQVLMVTLERDIEQAVSRPVRDRYGDTLPALQGGSGGLELTRSGWVNPSGQPRSELQRVAFHLEQGHLVRSGWTVLDRAQDSEPFAIDMLGGVKTVSLRFLDDSRQWRTSWPPPQQYAGDSAGPLPRAVELTMELDDWGVMTRLLRIASSLPDNNTTGGLQ
ncbi:MAG: type II secretion system minor pseudopilin GspJ [Gammaproteobacteria bacterium]|nr:type II secretion system minor pseudopilin GspJ [Gammaproteobacteria bacterium]